jgi:hypothetical protein
MPHTFVFGQSQGPVRHRELLFEMDGDFPPEYLMTRFVPLGRTPSSKGQSNFAGHVDEDRTQVLTGASRSEDTGIWSPG